MNVEAKVLERIAEGVTVFPEKKNWLRAFSVSEPKVLVLGQDPYHGKNQANGLAFSVEKGARLPPSLRNIFLELQEDVGGKIPSHGDLSAWALQGVALLNTILTVEEGCPLAHEKFGWQEIVFSWVEKLICKEKPLVILLWGKKAEKFFDPLLPCLKECHLVLRANHPSPLSAHRGFFGSRPFSKANAFLKQHGLDPIDWSIL